MTLRPYGRRRTTKRVVTSVKLTLVVDIFTGNQEDVDRLVKRIIRLPGVIAIKERHEGALPRRLRGNANVPTYSSETIPMASLQRRQNGMDKMHLGGQRGDAKDDLSI
jgi:hypothetical protein